MDYQDSPFHLRPGFGGAVVRFADKRWYLREWHSHEAVEINLVLRGTGSVLLEDRRYPLLPGYLIWLWPGQRHIPSGWSADMLMWIVEWKSDFFPRLQRARRRDHPRPGDLSQYACRRLEASSLQRVQGILSGVAGMEKPDAYNQGLYFALIAIWDEFVSAKPVARETFLHPKLEQVLGLMNDLSSNLSLEQLAETVKMSPHYLSVLFQKQTGMTVPEYRNRQRLNQFFSLYRARPEIRLLEHVYEAGFGSYAQFYRVFTESTGQTPRQWLRANRQ
jgi:AraC-like DNA-binding protein